MTECSSCGEQSEDIRLAVVSVDGTKFYGDLWMCEKCGEVFNDYGDEVRL